MGTQLKAVSHRLGRAGIAIALAGASFVSGCANKKPMSGPVIVPVGSFVQSWVFPLDWSKQHDSIKNLYLRDGTLYAYSERNTVVAITAASGHALYSKAINPGGIPLQPPVVVKDRVAFPSANMIDILDKTGKEVDSVKVDHSIRSPGMAGGDTIYLGLDYPNGGRLAAVDLSRKYDRVRWEMMTFAGLSAAPAIHAGIIFAASEDGRIYAVGEDRLGVWPLEQGSFFQTDGKIRADVKADDTGVYVASTDTKLYCLELATGKIKWQYYATVPLNTAPSLTTTMVYLPVDTVGVVALGKTEGKYNREPKWIAHGAIKLLSEDETFAYILGSGNQILAIEKTSGTVKFRSKRSDLATFATNLNPKDATIFAATKDGTIIAIKPVTKPGAVGELVRNDDWMSTPVALAN